MKNYQLFEVLDFVTDENFICYVKERKPRDVSFWEEWLCQNPSKHLAIAEATKIVQSIEIKQDGISDAEMHANIEKIMGLITEPVPIIRKRTPFVKYISRVAAILFMVVASGLIWKSVYKKGGENKYQYEQAVMAKNMVEHVNHSAMKISLALPDGSTVELSPKSKISYSDSFGVAGERDIYLSGEAFFIVSKNAARPFRVYANELATKVLGTSFTVRSFEKERSISVTVRTGKVSVYSQLKETATALLSSKQMGGIILTPNQQITYQKNNEAFEKRLVEQPAVIDSLAKAETMIFNEEPVIAVFQRINKLYGIPMQYDNEKFKDCKVTADIANEPLLKKLELICEAVNASYEIISGEIIITGNGCH